MHATHYFAGVAVLAFSATGGLGAQTAEATHKDEIGLSAGVTIVSQSGFPTVTSLAVPGSAGPLSPFTPVLYASFFASPSLMAEPQFSFSSTSSSGTTVTQLLVVLQVAHLFSPNAKGSTYVGVNGAYQTFSPGGGASSTSGPGLGGEIGYRVKIKNSLAVRVNGRYRRWFSDFKDVNEIGFGLGLGALF
jgi:hypothetical protein